MRSKSELESFDGLDNRRELMILLQRLGTDQDRANFISSLVQKSQNGFAGVQAKVVNCDPVAAYFMLVSVCNEVGVPINDAAKRLERVVSKK